MQIISKGLARLDRRVLLHQLIALGLSNTQSNISISDPINEVSELSTFSVSSPLLKRPLNFYPCIKMSHFLPGFVLNSLRQRLDTPKAQNGVGGFDNGARFRFGLARVSCTYYWCLVYRMNLLGYLVRPAPWRSSQTLSESRRGNFYAMFEVKNAC